MRESEISHTRRRRRGAANQRGFTLLELLIAATILLVILMVGVTLASQASSAWHNVYHDTQAVHNARSGLAAVAEELRQSNTGVVTVDATGIAHDRLTYQVPVGRSGETILWGAEGNQDWRLQVRVDGDRLVRDVLNAAGEVQGRPQVLATSVDGLYQGDKGFSVSVSDGLYTIRLRTTAATNGHVWRKEVATTIVVRN